MSGPRLLVTTGEPAGVGPELLVKLAQQRWPCQLATLADPVQLRATAAQLGLPLAITTVALDQHWPDTAPGQLNCVPLSLPAPVEPGRLALANTAFVIAQLQCASTAALAGQIDAIVTNPVHKGIINDSGLPFSGHTEFFAERAGADVLMLLACEGLRVALATTHLPLRAVADAITPERLASLLRLLHRQMQREFALSSPRIAVLGLNPHAGEGGHLGDEELRVITPVLERLREEGLALTGPLSADTAFTADKRQQFDAYLAMYHDQGLPVLKTLGFHRSVNITLGLPYVRTSVDHGTALDLAGTGKADAGSLIYACETALAMLACRKRRPNAGH